jgi:NADH:ubiquinone oxidoreductase subunit K
MDKLLVPPILLLFAIILAAGSMTIFLGIVVGEWWVRRQHRKKKI